MDSRSQALLAGLSARQRQDVQALCTRLGIQGAVAVRLVEIAAAPSLFNLIEQATAVEAFQLAGLTFPTERQGRVSVPLAVTPLPPVRPAREFPKSLSRRERKKRRAR